MAPGKTYKKRPTAAAKAITTQIDTTTDDVAAILSEISNKDTPTKEDVKNYIGKTLEEYKKEYDLLKNLIQRSKDKNDLKSVEKWNDQVKAERGGYTFKIYTALASQSEASDPRALSANSGFYMNQAKSSIHLAEQEVQEARVQAIEASRKALSSAAAPIQEALIPASSTAVIQQPAQSTQGVAKQLLSLAKKKTLSPDDIALVTNVIEHLPRNSAPERPIQQPAIIITPEMQEAFTAVVNKVLQSTKEEEQRRLFRLLTDSGHFTRTAGNAIMDAVPAGGAPAAKDAAEAEQATADTTNHLPAVNVDQLQQIPESTPIMAQHAAAEPVTPLVREDIRAKALERMLDEYALLVYREGTLMGDMNSTLKPDTEQTKAVLSRVQSELSLTNAELAILQDDIKRISKNKETSKMLTPSGLKKRGETLINIAIEHEIAANLYELANSGQQNYNNLHLTEEMRSALLEKLNSMIPLSDDMPDDVKPLREGLENFIVDMSGNENRDEKIELIAKVRKERFGQLLQILEIDQTLLKALYASLNNRETLSPELQEFSISLFKSLSPTLKISGDEIISEARTLANRIFARTTIETKNKIKTILNETGKFNITVDIAPVPQPQPILISETNEESKVSRNTEPTRVYTSNKDVDDVLGTQLEEWGFKEWQDKLKIELARTLEHYRTSAGYHEMEVENLKRAISNGLRRWYGKGNDAGSEAVGYRPMDPVKANYKRLEEIVLDNNFELHAIPDPESAKALQEELNRKERRKVEREKNASPIKTPQPSFFARIWARLRNTLHISPSALSMRLIPFKKLTPTEANKPPQPQTISPEFEFATKAFQEMVKSYINPFKDKESNISYETHSIPLNGFIEKIDLVEKIKKLKHIQYSAQLEEDVKKFLKLYNLLSERKIIPEGSTLEQLHKPLLKLSIDLENSKSSLNLGQLHTQQTHNPTPKGNQIKR